MKKIYVASSWRNSNQPMVVDSLRKHGHQVYDFRQPSEGDNGFHWSDIEGGWRSWSVPEYIHALHHPIAQAGFKKDFEAMQWADIFVGVQPFGRSASLELGWACGQGKPTYLLLDNGEPELMVKMVDGLCVDIQEIIKLIDIEAVAKMKGGI